MDSDIPLWIIIAVSALVLIVIFIIYKYLTRNENSEEEIISMVKESHEKGELQDQEVAMINNVFEFDDTFVKDIMIHRGDILAIDGDTTLADAIDIFMDNHFSRFPVFDEDLDNIIGIVHMRELFEASLEKVNFKKKLKDISDLMYDATFVPETRSINTLFTYMQKQKTHLVLVRDEYGQISGLVTMEDIIEEIFGNIFDEYDVEDKPYKKVGEREYIMYGKTELCDVANCLQIEFDVDDIETLNGFLLGEIGQIPKEGETPSVEYKGYTFKVLNVKDNMIRAVRVQSNIAYSG